MGRTSAAVVDNFQVKIQAPGNFLAVQDFTFQVQQPDAVANKGNFFRLRAVVHAEAHRRFHVDCLMCCSDFEGGHDSRREHGRVFVFARSLQSVKTARMQTMQVRADLRVLPPGRPVVRWSGLLLCAPCFEFLAI